MKTTSLIAFTVIAAAFLLPCVAPADSTADKPAKESALVNLELKDVPVKEAIAALFKGTTYSYYAEPGVSGKVVELKLKGITFEQALKALTDAAELTYTVEDGTYIIGPLKPAAETDASPVVAKSESGQDEQPLAGEPGQPPVEPAAQPGSPTTQVMINEQPAPVYYGQPGPGPYSPYGYYGYPPPYSIGNVRVIPGGWSPIVITGAGPSVVGMRSLPPPPASWVSPEVLRFLRYRYILPSRFYWSPYGW